MGKTADLQKLRTQLRLSANGTLGNTLPGKICKLWLQALLLNIYGFSKEIFKEIIFIQALLLPALLQA